jgi:uroporphyrinogen III methyltransferase/synthase
VDAAEIEPHLRESLLRGEIDFITLTSSNIARALLGGLDAACRERIAGGAVKLVTISPVTSAAVQELGLPVAGEATTYTTDGIVEALRALA